MNAKQVGRHNQNARHNEGDGHMAAVSVSPEERRAAELLVEMLGAERWTARDAHGADAGTHDLNLEMPDGSVIAVEVTRDASGADCALDDALTEHPIEAPGLAAVWRVWVTPRCRAKELQKKLPGLLAEMEKGERRNWVPKPSKRSDSDPCLDLKLRKLGVWHARRCELDEQGPRVLLRRADSPGSTGAAAIPDAVQRHVEGNRCKLLRTPETAVRHLRRTCSFGCNPISRIALRAMGRANSARSICGGSMPRGWL